MDLLSNTGWENILIDAVIEPAWIGSAVADVMGYVRGMPMARSLPANLSDKALIRQVFAAIAEQYAVNAPMECGSAPLPGSSPLTAPEGLIACL